MTTSDMPATGWRELAAELTPSQYAALERVEAKMGAHAGILEGRLSLLDFARDYSALNLADKAFAAVPVPAGATADRWERDLVSGGYSRALQWVAIGATGPVSVDIDGRQADDGGYDRRITLWGSDDATRLTAERARELAGLLLAAADALDVLDAGDQGAESSPMAV